MDKLKKYIYQSKNNAVKFLYSSKKEDGLWYDFKTHSSGTSSDWITSYVLFSLSQSLRVNEEIKRAFRKLEQSGRKRVGWGWSINVPSDCDSTSTVLLAFYSFNKKIKDASRLFNFIIEHQDQKTGGFSTFSDENILKLYRGNQNEDFSGWIMPHVCVTALALRAIKYYTGIDKKNVVIKALAYLINSQNQNGYWESYWWRTKYYSTYHIIAGLLENKNNNLLMKLETTFKWLCDTQKTDGYWENGYDENPCLISTVYALNSILILQSYYKKSVKSIFKKGLEWILDNQQGDGSWNNKPFFQIPPPHIKEPKNFIYRGKKEFGTGSCSSDVNRIYTTATTIYFLSKFLRGKNDNIWTFSNGN